MIRALNLPQRLANILAARGKAADFTKDCRCIDDSDGRPPRLEYWDAVKLGPEPTQEEVDAVDLKPKTRKATWERIKAERERRTLEGGYTAAGKWFHSDGLSRTQQLGLVLLGASIPPGTQWKTMDGSFVPMTQQLAQAIFAAAAASDIAIFAAAEAHRAAMEQAEDPAAYDYSGGWPAGYGE